LTLRNDGGVLIVGGSCRKRARNGGLHVLRRASISRSSENWRVICEAPTMLVDDMLSIPRSARIPSPAASATAEAIVSGLAPGSAAETWMVGEVDVGQRRNRQLAVGEDAEGEDADHDEPRHDGPANEDL
jgi:hypothetical protein